MSGLLDRRIRPGPRRWVLIWSLPVDSLCADIGGQPLLIDPQTLSERPALQGYADKPAAPAGPAPAGLRASGHSRGKHLF